MSLNNLFSGSVAEITALVAAIGLVVKHLLDRRKLNSSDLKFMVERQSKDVEDLKIENKELTRKYNSLNTRFNFLENAKFQSSIPQWVKDRKSRLVYGNKAYIEQFLTPNGIKYEDAIDKDDLGIWGSAELANLYMANDRQVMRSGVGSFFQGEMAIAGLPVEYRAYVDPVTINGQITGVVGMAVPME